MASEDFELSFDQLFGGAQGAIDFGAEEAIPPLPIPAETDTLEQMARKLVALATSVEQGKSLAVHTGYTGAAHTTRDPTELAQAWMDPLRAEAI